MAHSVAHAPGAPPPCQESPVSERDDPAKEPDDEPSPDDPGYYHVPGEYVAGDDDPDALRDDFAWPEYIGETRRREPWLAAALTLLAPGMGYLYMGRFLSGMMLNMLYPAAFFALVVAWTLMKFFPVVPLAVLIGCTLVMQALFLWDVLGMVRRERPYVLRPTNHLVVYVVAWLFTFAVPLYTVVHWSLTDVWQRTWAGSDSMYPTITRGDLVLVDRTAFVYRGPQRGELVLVEEPAEADGGIYFARVIGIGTDRIHMEGAVPWVNGNELGQLRHGRIEDLENHPTLAETSLTAPSLWAYVETPHGIELAEGDEKEPERWYMIARPVHPIIEPTRPVELEKDEVFVLSDNRSVPFGRRDENIGGRVIERQWVVGRPLFVLFSIAPDEGEVRWERIGLRLR